MVDLAQYANLVEDLVGAFGVAKLGAFDGHDSAVLESALVDFAVASDAEKPVAGEVVSGFLYLSAAEKFGGSATATGVQNSFALLG